MRIFITAGLTLLLSACGGDGNGSSADEANAAATNMMADPNMTVDQPGAIDPLMNLEGNGSADPAVQNMMQQDATTNDRDTNLANGI